MGDKNTPEVRRRKVLQTVGTSAAVGAVGLSAFTGTAAAWGRQTVDFKGCSEVWIVVDPDDINYKPPAVVRVVVALPDGTAVCRDVEFTTENTTRIPGQYGAAPLRRVTVGDDEKVLGVVFYNYSEKEVERFSDASCIVTNEHRCAMTPNTPSMEDAGCVQKAREKGGYYSQGEIANGAPGRSGGKNSKDKDSDDGGRGPPEGERRNRSLSFIVNLLKGT